MRLTNIKWNKLTKSIPKKNNKDRCDDKKNAQKNMTTKNSFINSGW